MKKITSLLLISISCLMYKFSNAQIFHEDFEIADSVTYWSNSSANWGQNSRLSTSGMYCDSASIQNVGDTIIMTTIPFSTMGNDSVYLYFNHIGKVEFFDGAFIEVSSDGGITWVKLQDDNPGTNNCTYYGLGLFPSQGSNFQEANYVSWQPGNPIGPEQNWWKREIFDVSTLLNNTPNAQIRFILTDRNLNGGAYRKGWFIDDILVNDSLNTYLYTFQNAVKGKMFVDLNSNLIQDAGEPPVKWRNIRELNSINWTYTNSDGQFLLPTLTVGAVDVQTDSILANHPYFNLVPNIHTSTFTSIGQIDSLKDFALQPTVLVNNLSIRMSQMYLCKNTLTLANYWICAYNTGSTVMNPDIILYPNNQLTFDSSSISPTFVSNDSIGWTLGPLYVFKPK